MAPYNFQDVSRCSIFQDEMSGKTPWWHWPIHRHKHLWIAKGHSHPRRARHALQQASSKPRQQHATHTPLEVPVRANVVEHAQEGGPRFGISAPSRHRAGGHGALSVLKDGRKWLHDKAWRGSLLVCPLASGWHSDALASHWHLYHCTRIASGLHSVVKLPK